LRTLARHAQNVKSGKIYRDIGRRTAIGASAVRGRLAAGAPPGLLIDAGHCARIDRCALLA